MTHDLDHDQIALLVYEKVQKGKESEKTEFGHPLYGTFQPVLDPKTGQTEKFAFAWCPNPDRC